MQHGCGVFALVHKVMRSCTQYLFNKSFYESTCEATRSLVRLCICKISIEENFKKQTCQLMIMPLPTEYRFAFVRQAVTNYA